MIDRHRLRELHGVDLPLHVLEQDYVQALFLQELYRETDGFVFKGGTYLKHVHGLDRFSADLDFTRYGDMAITDGLEGAAEALDRYGLPATIDRIERQSNTVRGRLRYEGPLFDGSDRSRGSIALDVSTRDDIVRDPEWRRLFVPYPETRAVTARCLVVEEAFAEKLRALSTRSLGRDLYDCWFLLQQDVPIEPELYQRKMTAIGEPNRVTISTPAREWNRELAVLLEHPPAYDKILEEVVEAVRATNLSVEVAT